MTVTYVIAAERYDGWAKIGRTTHIDVARRVSGCQTGNPRRLRVVAWWDGDHERLLHEHLEAVRGNGEWFALPTSMLAEFAQMAGERLGFAGVLSRWSVARIAEVAESDDPEVAAGRFACPADALTAHDRPRRRLNAL